MFYHDLPILLQESITTERQKGRQGKRQKETKGAETRGRMEIKKEEWARATDKEMERQRVRDAQAETEMSLREGKRN